MTGRSLKAGASAAAARLLSSRTVNDVRKMNGRSSVDVEDEWARLLGPYGG